VTPDAATQVDGATRVVRGRAIALGLVAVLVTTLLVTQAELVLSTLRIGYLQMPPIAISILVVALGINRLVGWGRKRWQLGPADLLTIYCMVVVAAMVSSHGVVEKLVPQLIAAHYFADDGNNWHRLFDLNLDPRLVPYNPAIAGHQAVVDQFFTGVHRGAGVPWQAWLIPIGNWAILIGLVVAAFLFLTTLLRKQWAENERLSFPLAQLPLEIAQSAMTPRDRRMIWLGTTVPALVYTINAIHQLAPSVPEIKLIVPLNDLFHQPPWNQIGWCPLMFSFAAIGFFFLLPADIALSIWFFFVLQRVQEAVAVSYDMATPGMPIYPPKLFIGYETVGAYIVLTGYLFWSARAHLRSVWLAAIGRADVDDSAEAVPYKVAFWGLLVCVAGSAIWLWLMGMSLWLAVLEIVVFVFMIALVMARSTAEGGMLMTETTFRPIDVYRMFGSVHALGPHNLALLAMVDNVLLRDQRGLLLTGFLDTAKIADGARIDRRSMARNLVLAVLVAFVAAVALNIYVSYHLGAERLDQYLVSTQPQFTLSDYAPFFKPGQGDFPAAQNWQMPVFCAAGAIVTLALTILRANIYWWPLHPIGLALSGSWAATEFWFPCLVAWMIKSGVVRYAGMSAYARMRPFFLGLILGECVMATIFALLNILFHLPAPAFPWA